MENLLDSIDLKNVSDIFLTETVVPHVRRNDSVIPLDMPEIPAGAITEFRKKILSPEEQQYFLQYSCYDKQFVTASGRRFRANFCRSSCGETVALRSIKSAENLDFETLGLPAHLKNLALKRRGLILICGATGSGKSTTLATIINAINTSQQRHILTLEDPIEFVFKNKKSLITQREIRYSGFSHAVRDAMRKNPDVIVIGEMRDMETAQAAINAALTGHLVISTIHTGNAVLAIERIVNLFPHDMREQLAQDIAGSVQGIIAQRLIPRIDNSSMIPVVEYLPASPMAAKLISHCRFAELEEVLRQGNVPGMCNFSRAIFDLCSKGLISKTTALENTDNPEELMLLFEGMKSGIDTFRRVYSGNQNQHANSIDLGTLLYSAVRNGSSDLILTVDTPPQIRINGEIRALDLPPLRPEDTASLLHGILTPHQRIDFEEKRELDIALTLNLKKQNDGSVTNGRFRINAFHQRNSIGLVARVINNQVPEPEKLGLPPVLLHLASKMQGLILVTGPTGSGKSTTLASMIDHINRKRAAHIITIEDPIEYVHKNICSTIEQRELHADTLSFSGALRSALRQDPDVILVGEMRDTETMAAAITAAETGHLVLATVHTNSAPQTIDRIVDSFPDYQQNQIRLQLAGVILGVVSQRLLPKKDGSGRTAVFEIMVGTSPIQALIREGKTHLLRSSIETGYKDGMITMERALDELRRKNLVAPEELARLY